MAGFNEGLGKASSEKGVNSFWLLINSFLFLIGT
jgi:hypothetical protein